MYSRNAIALTFTQWWVTQRMQGRSSDSAAEMRMGGSVLSLGAHHRINVPEAFLPLSPWSGCDRKQKSPIRKLRA